MTGVVKYKPSKNTGKASERFTFNNVESGGERSDSHSSSSRSRERDSCAFV